MKQIILAVLALLLVGVLAGGAMSVPRIVLQRGARAQLNFACGAYDNSRRPGLLYRTPKNFGYRYSYNNNPSWLAPSGTYRSVLSGFVPNTNYNSAMGVNYAPLSLGYGGNGRNNYIIATAGAPNARGAVGDLALLFRGIFNTNTYTVSPTQGSMTILCPVLPKAPTGSTVMIDLSGGAAAGSGATGGAAGSGTTGGAAGSGATVTTGSIAGGSDLGTGGAVEPGVLGTGGSWAGGSTPPASGAGASVVGTSGGIGMAGTTGTSGTTGSGSTGFGQGTTGTDSGYGQSGSVTGGSTGGFTGGSTGGATGGMTSGSSGSTGGSDSGMTTDGGSGGFDGGSSGSSGSSGSAGGYDGGSGSGMTGGASGSGSSGSTGGSGASSGGSDGGFTVTQSTSPSSPGDIISTLYPSSGSGPLGNIGSKSVTYKTGNYTKSESSSSTYSTSDSSKSSSGTYTTFTIGGSRKASCGGTSGDVISGRGVISAVTPSSVTIDGKTTISFNSCTNKQYLSGRNNFEVGNTLSWDGFKSGNRVYGRKLACLA